MLQLKTTNTATSAAFSLFAIASATLMFSGCGGEPPGTQPQQVLGAPPLPPPDSMHVYDSTLTRLSGYFVDNVDLDPGVRMLYTEQELPWTTLAAMAPTNSNKHGLLVDYGLTGDSLRLGFSFARLASTAKPDEYTYAAPDTLFDFWNAALTPMIARDWRLDHQLDTTNASVYFSRVRIRHTTSGAFDPVDPLSDARADMMAWEDEVKAMYDENAAGHGDSTMHLVVRCIARADARGDLRHAICYHLRLRPANGSGFRDLLDDSYDKNALLRMHGCDFGTLCPPTCATYTEPAR